MAIKGKADIKWAFQDRKVPDLEAWHEYVNAVKARFGRDALDLSLAGYKEIQARWESRRDDQVK